MLEPPLADRDRILHDYTIKIIKPSKHQKGDSNYKLQPAFGVSIKCSLNLLHINNKLISVDKKLFSVS